MQDTGVRQGLDVLDYDPESALDIERHSQHEQDRSSDRGATTAEYAVVTLAAVGFAGLLILLLRSDEARGLLWNIISSALAF